MTKKLISILLALTVILSFTACKKPATSESGSSEEVESTIPVVENEFIVKKSYFGVWCRYCSTFCN